MHITIENNRVIVNLDEMEFPKFQAMFNNLQLDKTVRCDFRDFKFPDFETKRDILLIHLCRTIGEANLGDDPFATVSLYPFWKYGFAFGTTANLTIDPQTDDAHKKAVIADEMGMGFCCWAMEELFDCEFWADCSALIKAGAVFPIGTKRPDFVCGFADGSLGIFEAKGTTGTAGNLALSQGKLQAQAITAPDPISQRVVVGCALGGDTAEIVLLDPPPPDPSTGSGTGNAEPTNLTADLVRKAAMKMRKPAVGEGLVPSRETTVTETIFRGPNSATGATREIALTHDDYKERKGHGWLEING